MPPVVKIEGLRALARALEAKVPELIGQIRVGQAPPGKPQTWPSVTLIPVGRWQHILYGAAHPIRSLPGHRTVFDCGYHQVSVQIIVAGVSYEARAELAEEVALVFRGADELRPNVLVTPITACVQLGDTFATFVLEGEEWDDTEAMARNFEDTLDVTATFPALSVDVVPTINQLLLGLSDRSPAPTAFDDPSVEVVQINDDGSISPA